MAIISCEHVLNKVCSLTPGPRIEMAVDAEGDVRGLMAKPFRDADDRDAQVDPGGWRDGNAGLI